MADHLIEARKVIAWPAVNSLLQNELAQIPNWQGENGEGEKWLTRITKDFEGPLPMGEPLDLTFLNGGTPRVWDSQTVCLTKSMTEVLCQAYFNSFHATYPILDRNHFYSVTLPQAFGSSFEQYDRSSTIVLLVLALGSVAREGASGNLILQESTGRKTGVRGGTLHRAPGLEFLTEAKKRIGFVLSEYDVITLQCFILFS